MWFIDSSTPSTEGRKRGKERERPKRERKAGGQESKTEINTSVINLLCNEGAITSPSNNVGNEKKGLNTSTTKASKKIPGSLNYLNLFSVCFLIFLFLTG